MNHVLQEVPGAPGSALVLQVHRAGDTAVLARVRLRPAVGRPVPRFWFHVGCTVHASPSLGLFHRQRTLQLGNDHTGASELVLEAGATGDATETATALQLALQGALLVLADRRALFAARLIAELPGLRDGTGDSPAQSPFWQGLVRHFHTGDPLDAQRRLGEDWRAGVAALLPRHLIYTAFLPPSAQAAIAQVHATALQQREALEEAGLRYGHHVTIDEAGPVLEAETDGLPAVATSRATSVADTPAAPGATPHWVLAGEPAQARVARVPLSLQDGLAALPEAAQRLLGTGPGQPVRVLPARGG
ncbi:MAG: arginine N-succinyltransferase [Rubrivivax sp.]|nr:arginine N-succinyltransferase [Rubrivivax sp.]